MEQTEAKVRSVLVVEDEQRLGAALKRGLTAEGMLVDLATSGPAGLEAARLEITMIMAQQAP